MLVSQVLGAGTSPLLAQAIGGVGVNNVVALGTNQATATPLPGSLNFLTTSAGGTGVKLPPAEMGNEVWLYNNSGVTVAVFPFETAGTVFNGGSPVSSILSAKAMLFKCVVNGVWLTMLTA